MAINDSSLRKRQQIAKANRTMFIWVAGASVVVGIALVLSIFLIQKLIFNEKVLSKKQNTVSTLTQNNKAVDDLKKNARVLNTDQDLLSVRAKEGDTALQVILDALPSEPNSSALGSSLQNVLLPGEGISVDSLVVEPIIGSESTTDESTTAASNAISFTFSVSAPSDNIDSLRDLLRRLERSIRAIDVQTASLEMQGSRIALTASAIAYYEPAKSIELKTETVKPTSGAKR